MKLAVVACPQISPSDLGWIETLRAIHDPQSARISVHFTLVFPVEAALADLGPELAAVGQTFSPIAFGIRDVTVVRDRLKGTHQVLLVPGEGGPQIRALHARLYAGGLHTHVRADIPFVPHMTVGAARDAHDAERLALAIAATARRVRGRVTTLEVVDVGAAPVQRLAAYGLTGLTT
jgi:2'-5' RNA ligase